MADTQSFFAKIEAQTFKAALARVSLAASPSIRLKRSRRYRRGLGVELAPILATVLLEPNSSGLLLTCSDASNLRCEVQIACGGVQGAPVAVSVKSLSALLYRAPKDTTAVMALMGDKLRVQIGALNAELFTLPATDFPAWEDAPSNVSIAAPIMDFRSLLVKTHHAMSNEETRYLLQGVFLHAIDLKICAVATDGHRLSLVKSDIAVSEALSAIVPRRVVLALDRLMAREPGEVKIEIGNFRATFSFGSTTVRCKLIDGSFPDYQKVIPKEFTAAATFDRSGTLAMLQQLKRFGGKRSRAVKWALNGSLELSANSTEYGDVQMTGPCRLVGKPIEMGINAQYAIEALGVLTGPDALLEINEGLDPVRFSDPDNPSHIMVLMPMRS